jgi:exportin-2 (importin alpha re-exporter)
LGAAKEVLGRVSGNPTDPMFNHYLFETIAALLKTVCAHEPEASAAFEEALWPVFDTILGEGVPDFLPYVFQVMAGLIDTKPAPEAGASTIPSSFVDAFPAFFKADLWESKGNVPALVALLSAYLRKGASFIAEGGHMEPVLGIFAKLLTAVSTTDSGFKLLAAVITHSSMEALAPHIGTVITIILQRLHKKQSLVLLRHYLRIIGLLAAVHGGEGAEASLNSADDGLLFTNAEQLIVPHANKVLGRINRKVMVVGLTRLITEVGGVAERPPLWVGLVGAIVELLEAKADRATDAKEDGDDTEQMEYAASFSRLTFAVAKQEDPLPDVEDARVAFIGQLSEFAAAHGGAVSAMLGEAPAAVTKAVSAYADAAGVAIA